MSKPGMNRKLVIGAVAVLAIGWWWFGRSGSHANATDDGSTDTSEGAVAHHRTVGPDLAGALGKAGRSGAITFGRGNDGDGVVISGKVIDAVSHDGVGPVEVVLRSPQGEETTTSNADGTYAIRVPMGIYRAFVRDDSVLSVGRTEHVRLPGTPSADTAGVPDEALMPQVMANQNVDNIELTVSRGGTVAGKVVDSHGKPVVGAVMFAQGQLRPTLGTDVAESDESGSFELRVPAGYYKIGASHPRYAGVAGETDMVQVEFGGHVDVQITLVAGCVITGKVIAADGKPASDGAMEQQWGQGDLEFGPAGRIEPDGTFRWTTSAVGDVVLRAWPWKSPPSNTMKFACKEGVRYANVTLQVQPRSADIDGILVDHNGQPLGFTFIDLAPLDAGGMGQQERTDAEGHWQVFSMPGGRYRLTAQSPEHGVAIVEVHSPQTGVRVELGGTGRLEGTTSTLANGSFDLTFESCQNATGDGAVRLERQRRLVSVVGGHFAVDDVPACAALDYRILWHGIEARDSIAVPSGGIAQVAFNVGPPKLKTVHGRVTQDGKPVAGATVRAHAMPGGEVATATTDADGRYTLKTTSGAYLDARAPSFGAYAEVGTANVDDEEVDLVMSAGDTENPEGEGFVPDLPDEGGD